MMTKTAKEFLQGIRANDRRIQALLARKQAYYDMAMRGTGSMEATRLSGDPAHSRVEDCVCKMVDMEREMDEDIDRLVDQTRQAETIIGQIKDKRYQDVLRYRYLSRWCWDQIAIHMGYDKRWLFKVHGAALLAFEKIWRPT